MMDPSGDRVCERDWFLFEPWPRSSCLPSRDEHRGVSVVGVEASPDHTVDGRRVRPEAAFDPGSSFAEALRS